jgi:hypothetical protein
MVTSLIEDARRASVSVVVTPMTSVGARGPGE